jgi:hypothetical protein
VDSVVPAGSQDDPLVLAKDGLVRETEGLVRETDGLVRETDGPVRETDGPVSSAVQIVVLVRMALDHRQRT